MVIVRAYADALERYECYLVTYQSQVANYRAVRQGLDTIWKEKLREEYPNLNDATFLECYVKAFDDGHSAGYGEVRNCMIDIADFAEKIIAANK